LAFKTYQNKELENFFKIQVRDAQIRMDEKLGETKNMDKALSNKQKANLIRNKKTL
jgi:hypothetical protein